MAYLNSELIHRHYNRTYKYINEVKSVYLRNLWYESFVVVLPTDSFFYNIIDRELVQVCFKLCLYSLQQL